MLTDKSLINIFFEKTNTAGIVFLDCSLKIVSCNKAFMRFLDIDYDLKGLPVNSIINNSSINIEDAESGEKIIVDFSVKDKIIVPLSCIVVKDSENIILFSEKLKENGINIVHKISVLNQQLSDASREINKKNRQLNHTLLLKEEAEKRARILLNASNDAVVLLNTECEIEDSNKIFKDLFFSGEESKDSILNKKIFKKNHFSFIKDKIKEVKEMHVPASGEKELFNKTYNWRIYPVEDENKRISRLACFFSDITEQKGLEQVAIERSRLQMAEEISSGIAHDINNILMGLSANLFILDREKQRLEKPQRLDTMKDLVEKASSLMDKMLIYTGGLNLEFRNCSVNELIEEIIEISGKEGRSPEISFEKKGKEPFLNADPLYLSQAFYQVIKNSREAVKDKGKINVKTFCAEDETRVFIEIKDNGSGIPEEIMDKIFNPFFSTKFLGRGMGLPAVQGIVKSHNGTISIKNNKDRGVSVLFSFPLDN